MPPQLMIIGWLAEVIEKKNLITWANSDGGNIIEISLVDTVVMGCDFVHKTNSAKATSSIFFVH